MSVNVMGMDEGLKTQVAIKNNTGNKVSAISFENTYEPLASGGTSGNTKGVKTGDDANPELCLILFFAGGMVLLTYISFKIRRKE